jgi:crotonobetainyl-CoA:carnitine CoA-transferase CaiB-like acyl-CoA transferase
MRVLDITTNVSGPMVTMILAKFGADVIKIERPPTGDPLRPTGDYKVPGGIDLIVDWANAGKRSISLDMGEQRGLEVFRRLARRADVLVHNFKPGVAERLGMGEQEVRALRADILYCHVSAFGSGPIGSELRGYDVIAQAFSGIMDMTGFEGGRAARCAPSVVDISNALWTTIAILVSLMARDRGQRVDSIQTALIDAAMALAPWQTMGGLVYNTRPPRQSIPPFDAADRPFYCMAGRGRRMEQIAEIAGCPEVSEDPRFRDPAAFDANVEAYVEELSTHFRREPAEHWVARLHEVGIPAAPVLGVEEAVRHPLADERNWFEQPGTVPLVRLPMLFDGNTVITATPAPRLGEHGVELLHELGYEDSEVKELIAAGILQVPEN